MKPLHRVSSDRIPCCILGCRRTFRDDGTFTEIMCGDHYRLTDKSLRSLRTKLRRRARRQGWTERSQMFNHCANGHETESVVNVAANFLIAAIGMHLAGHGGSRNDAVSLAKAIGEQLPISIADQWDRQPQPTDIEVHHGH